MEIVLDSAVDGPKSIDSVDSNEPSRQRSNDCGQNPGLRATASNTRVSDLGQVTVL